MALFEPELAGDRSGHPGLQQDREEHREERHGGDLVGKPLTCSVVPSQYVPSAVTTSAMVATETAAHVISTPGTLSSDTVIHT